MAPPCREEPSDPPADADGADDLAALGGSSPTLLRAALASSDDGASGEAALQALLPVVYRRLRDIARGYLGRERRGHTLSPTALVHEAYLRLLEQPGVQWRGGAHVVALAAHMMRRVLVNHAVARQRVKRGQGWQRVTIDTGLELAASPAEPHELDLIGDRRAAAPPGSARRAPGPGGGAALLRRDDHRGDRRGAGDLPGHRQARVGHGAALAPAGAAGRVSAMTPERWHEVKAALELALELAGAARAAFLDGIGSADPDLRREVEELLAGEAQATPLTGVVAAAVVAAAGSPGEPGARIGPYLLEAELGRGGMGAVYRARRADGQYEAEVAVKLARADLDGELAAGRFRLERQYLAALEHPFIARLLDGGVTEDGRLYLVLELVDGVPIDDHCAARALGLTERLELVRKVCAAVEYAHQRLIVHRDLKPSNVLVRPDGTPKLVDFGIAKLLRPDAAPGAATEDAGRFLTPGYASPEQRAGLPVSTASDVYSLGVLLHELLAGSLPCPAPGDAEGALAEPMPVSAAAALEPGPAGLPGRRVEPRALRGDVDGIVARALRRSPQERYPTAAALDEDLRRFLEGEPVRARRATLGYRARKFVRRHAIGVAMVAALALSLGTGGALYAVEARTTARARAVAARRGELLVQMLRSADPAGGRRDVTVAEVLDAAAAQLGRDRGEDPAVAASLFQVLAETDKALGRYPQAIEASDRALALLRAHGGDPGVVADALMTRGEAQMHGGNLAGSEASLREALAVLASVRAVGTKRAQVHDLLGIALKQAGREQEAEASYRQAIALYRALGEQGDALLGYPLSNLGVLVGEQGHYAESGALVDEGLTVLRRHLPADHPDLLSFELDRAGALMGLHQAAAAEPLIRHVMEARTRVLGPEHKDTLNARVELVDCLVEQGRDAEAAAQGRPAAETLQRVLGFEHQLTLYGWTVYAAAACRTAEAADGLAALQRVETAREKLYGPADWHVASTRVTIGTCLATLGRLEEAEATLVRAARELEVARSPGFHRTQAAYQALRDLCARLGRGGEAGRWAAKLASPAHAPP